MNAKFNVDFKNGVILQHLSTKFRDIYQFVQHGRFGTYMTHGPQRVSLKFWNWLFFSLSTFLRLLENQNHNFSFFLGKIIFDLLLNPSRMIRFSKNRTFFNIFSIFASLRLFAIKGKVIPPFDAEFNVNFINGFISQHLINEIPRYLTICATC